MTVEGAQYKALDEALKDYDYNVITLPIIIGQSGSQYHTSSDAPNKDWYRSCSCQQTYVQIALTVFFEFSQDCDI